MKKPPPLQPPPLQPPPLQSQRAATPAPRPARTQTVHHPHHPPENDNLIVYLSVIAFAAIFGVLLAWVLHYQQQQQLASPDKTYVKMGTVRFQMADFSVRATFALQSTNEDLEWLNQNKSKVQKFLDTRLQDEKPATLVSSRAQKLPELQATMTEELNKKFPEAHIQQVLFTEFLTSHEGQ